MTTSKKNWLHLMLPAVLAVAGAGVGLGCSGGAGSSDEGTAADSVGHAATPITLNDDERREMVSKKTTCAFVGTALALKKLLVFGTKDTPLARIVGEGSIGAVGDTGGGDLSLGFRV